MRVNRLGLGCAAGLIALSTYMALDTFAISDSYQNDATMMNMALFDSSQEAEAEYESEADTERIVDSYDDGEKSVTIYEYRVYDTNVYVADVVLSSSEYLKSAFAEGTYGKNIKAATSQIAGENGAVLAINGDYYGARERGYVIRNGVLYRDSAAGSDVLCIYPDGKIEVVKDSDYTAQELVEKGVWQAFSFGPGLLENGEITVMKHEEVGRAMASNPRTAIGWVSDNHYLFVVSDGRTGDNDGLTLYELADFMKSLGAVTAYNMDGGGSSTMVFNGELINNPSAGGRHSRERSVSDIVYIG